MTFFDNFHSINLIAAHRGYRAYYPENTLAAFEASDGKCHFIELDVQLSRDLVPVVIRDPSLERTSNGVQKRESLGLQSLQVKDWSVEQLKTLDVGTWFYEKDPFGTMADLNFLPFKEQRDLPQQLLTLEELLQTSSLKEIPINIDIKDHRGWVHNQKVAERVINVIRKTQSQTRVLISSINHDYLVIAKKCAPELTTAALVDISHPSTLIEYLKSIGVAAYHPSDALTSPELVRQLRSAGFGVNVYTVNDKKRQQQLFDYGVTAIFTDFPELP